MLPEELHPKIAKVIENIEKVMVGKRQETILCLTALLAGGHVLLEDVPGVGKTMLVKSIAQSVSCKFKRIQFTPDLLPSDVLGVSIYNPKELQFEFRRASIMGNIILADEINRTSPKTQSALLEGWKRRVTIDGFTYDLPKPFFVMATQNPLEYEVRIRLSPVGSVLLKMKMGYPSFEEEMEVLNRVQQAAPFEKMEAVISTEELLHMQSEVKAVFVNETVKSYILTIVGETRHHADIALGVSPRGSVALMKAAQSYAYIHGRDFVIPDDIQFLVPFVFAHRIILKSEAVYDGKTAEKVVQDILRDTRVPITRYMKP